MYGFDSIFLYFCRRAQQEQVAAINAQTAAAEAAHRTLSAMHAARAILVALDAEETKASTEGGGKTPTRTDSGSAHTDSARLEVLAA